ncbi:MAG TPA: cyclic nucleotide-binding domain-containing protein [Cyclobacteriaceae bacterium]|nr:cyclic nucleotide-binding domain-containing protein [Cyclobacteriaceae bacterium]
MIENLGVPLADPETWKLIRDHPIFNDIEDGDVNSMIPFFKLSHRRPNEIFIEEGHDSKDLYLVLKGKLDVIKKSGDNGTSGDKSFIIAHLTAGDTIGELSFIKGTLRSASVKSNTKSILLGLDPDGLGRLETEYPRAAAKLMRNILGYIGTRVIQTSANQVQALNAELQNSIRNAKANLFFSYVIGLLCVYNLTIHLITNLYLDVDRASMISAIIIIIFCAVLVLMIRQTKLPIHIFGLTTKNWKPAVNESMLWSAVVIAAIGATKWTLIQTVPRYSHLPLIDFDFSRQHLAFNFLLYGLHSPVQEFIARGVLQGSLQHFFTGKNAVLRAVIVSNALFSATHVHLMNGLLGVIVFIPGLLWGWLYSRHENLIGVSISHILVGWSALFLFNLESLF